MAHHGALTGDNRVSMWVCMPAISTGLAFVQLPLLYIVSNNKEAPYKWLQLSHYISH